jgi:hypothetical protein
MRAEGGLGGRDLVAVVAIAAAGHAGLVAPGHAAAALRQLLAGLPVAHQLAVGRILDGFQLILLQSRRDVLGRVVAAAVADGLQAVLVHAVGGGDALGLEVAFQHGDGFGAVVADLVGVHGAAGEGGGDAGDGFHVHGVHLLSS